MCGRAAEHRETTAQYIGAGYHFADGPGDLLLLLLLLMLLLRTGSGSQTNSAAVGIAKLLNARVLNFISRDLQKEFIIYNCRILPNGRTGGIHLATE